MMEVAEILKVNPMTVRNWITREELPALRVGTRRVRVRVRRTDFDAFHRTVAGPWADRKSEKHRQAIVRCGVPGDRRAGAAAEGGAVHESQARPGVARATGTRVDTE